MRLLLLILMSFCAFAVEPDIHLPMGKDLPTWAKELSKKYEAAYGDNAPWRKLYKKVDRATKETEVYQPLKSKAESEYILAYQAALDEWVKTANCKNKMPEKADRSSEYNAALIGFEWDRNHNTKHTSSDWQPDDLTFIAYAQMNHDPLALAFLFVPVNRAKYCR